MFVCTKNNIATCFQTATLVKPDDSPPASRYCKMNLTISSLVWTHNDAFVIAIFSSGAIAVLPRLTGNFLKIINPTICMASKGDTSLAQHYSVPRSFIEVFTGAKQRSVDANW